MMQAAARRRLALLRGWTRAVAAPPPTTSHRTTAPTAVTATTTPTTSRRWLISLAAAENHHYHHATTTARRNSSRSSSRSAAEQEPRSQTPRKVLVIGSSGALGSHIARHLSRLHETTATTAAAAAGGDGEEEDGAAAGRVVHVLGADVGSPAGPRERTGEEHWKLTEFCRLSSPSSLPTTTLELVRAVHAFVGNDGPGLDAIVCAAGGWCGDPVPPPPLSAHHPSATEGRRRSLPELLEGAVAHADAVESMRRMNFDPVVAAAYLAQHFMVRAGDDGDGDGDAGGGGHHGGLLVVIGATAALQPTPGMLAYGLSKSAAHFCVQTLGACTGGGAGGSKAMRQAGRAARHHLPSLDDLTVVGILPTMLDTAANRAQQKQPPQQHGTAPPDADAATAAAAWTKPEHIAAEIGRWITTPPLRPHSGALVKVYHDAATGRAAFELVR